ncbi:CBS domain-containing protein [Oleisolibacter albus]|uniref:CBS domain-containing protein n=1 Tax=Oleisolibacter albus TaxID=2171757 RepID=UPI000DF4984B|nr:CBS domain-containing protein [Oleisolibacter albus]
MTADLPGYATPPAGDPPVADVMTRDLHFLSLEDTVQQAAQLMAELDAGALPVGSSRDLQGMITDRDILIRVVALGLDAAATPVQAVMSADVLTCRETDPALAVARTLAGRQVRRAPVLDGDGRVVGMVGIRALLDLLGRDRLPVDAPGPLR